MNTVKSLSTYFQTVIMENPLSLGKYSTLASASVPPVSSISFNRAGSGHIFGDDFQMNRPKW